MFCPHCHNKIPDGSNVCPLCFSNLVGVKPQTSYEDDDFPLEETPARAESGSRTKSSSKGSGRKSAYSKGSRGSKRSADRTPMIIAFGLIVILAVIIVMILRSMFVAGDANNPGATSTPGEPTPTPNFIVFGATATPDPHAPTRTPSLQVTPTPTPYSAAGVSYTTLKKGSMGADVVTLQRALAELGYYAGAADGDFGTGTQNAVRAFQKAQGLDDDGVAGRLTLEALYSISTVTPIPEVTVGPGDIMDLPG